MPNDTTIPARFREKAFKTYEIEIATAVNRVAQKQVAAFIPSGSCETFAGRLRDAMKGHRTYKYPNWSEDLWKQFIGLYDQGLLKVRIQKDGKVTVGPLEQPKQATVQEEKPQGTKLIVTNPSYFNLETVRTILMEPKVFGVDHVIVIGACSTSGLNDIFNPQFEAILNDDKSHTII